MGLISCQIAPLVINSLGGEHMRTHVHTHTLTLTLSLSLTHTHTHTHTHTQSNCVKHHPLGSGTSRWQNYGPFVWQWEEIHLIFANRPCIGY